MHKYPYKGNYDLRMPQKCKNVMQLGKWHNISISKENLNGQYAV